MGASALFQPAFCVPAFVGFIVIADRVNLFLPGRRPIDTLEFRCEETTITRDGHKAHGLDGLLTTPDWPALTMVEVDGLLRRYSQLGSADRLLSFSPRPFSAASLVATPGGKVFVKRYPRTVRDREGLLEEHRFISHLANHLPGLVQPALVNKDGESAIELEEWTYEVHSVAEGVDAYEEALSWTPFRSCGDARAAGRAMAWLHRAAESYHEPRRKIQQLVTSFTIFSGCGFDINPDKSEDSPAGRMESYLKERPLLRTYAEARNWRRSFDALLMPLYWELEPWLGYLRPLWTHNDFHASNLMWSEAGEGSAVLGVIDFGLADRTNTVHDLATAIERNIVEWLRMDEPGAEIVHLDHLDALLAGYEEITPLSYEQARALVAMLPLVHCEFALSETDYFLSVLHSEEKAYLAYEGYLLAHAEWFRTMLGRGLLEHLGQWADGRSKMAGGKE